jgi:hypothetical protein
MLQYAFKEWAVICRALTEGRQSLILRKGGIAETTGDFAVEHTRFWLFPTYVHQQRQGIKAAAVPLLEQVEAERPPTGVVRLTHFAEVAGAYRVRNLTLALMLDHMHLWSEETVRSRFNYRHAGIFVLPVRVFQAAHEWDLPVTSSYEGCKSWVDLGRELPTEGARPVLGDKDFRDVLRSLDLLLNPTALA